MSNLNDYFDLFYRSNETEKVETDKKTTLIIKAPGVRGDDVKLTVDDNVLYVEGTSEDKELQKKYNISQMFTIKTNVIDNITYDVRDGLIIIDLIKKDAQKTRVKINRK